VVFYCLEEAVRNWLLVIFVGLVSLVGCQMASEEPVIEVDVRKDGDVVETAVVGDAIIFDIYSQIGIGDAVIKRSRGEWPETILFRVYLTGLEEFKFAYGDTVVTTSVSSTDDYMVLTSTSQNGEERPVSKDSPYYMPVRNEAESSSLEEGYFEIKAPADFFAGEYDSFAISWVDFYR